MNCYSVKESLVRFAGLASFFLRLSDALVPNLDGFGGGRHDSVLKRLYVKVNSVYCAISSAHLAQPVCYDFGLRR